MRDPYSVLGVPRTADEAQIKKAFRTLAKKYHPDSNAGDASAKERFSEASNAYEFLSDKDKRGAYDRGEIDADGHPKFAGFQGFEGFRAGGARGGRPGGGTRHEWATGPGTSGGFKPEDILSQIFGGGRADAFAEARQRQPGGPEPRPQRGGDVKAKIAVTLEQIAAREKARVSLPTGKTLEVALPPKVADGQTIRLKGQGHAGPAGAGDALVTVQLVPHPQFKVDEADLTLEIPISLDEAVLGGKLTVPTLEGPVSMTLPKRADVTKAFRLRGKGLWRSESERGDLFVRAVIVLPPEGDDALDALMKRWRADKRHTPR